MLSVMSSLPLCVSNHEYFTIVRGLLLDSPGILSRSGGIFRAVE